MSYMKLLCFLQSILAGFSFGLIVSTCRMAFRIVAVLWILTRWRLSKMRSLPAVWEAPGKWPHPLPPFSILSPLRSEAMSSALPSNVEDLIYGVTQGMINRKERTLITSSVGVGRWFRDRQFKLSKPQLVYLLTAAHREQKNLLFSFLRKKSCYNHFFL